MFIVFITSLLLVLPPLTVSVYLWTSVARFYDEIKHYEKAVKEISRRHNTMRLLGNLIVNNQSQHTDNFSITPRTFNSTNNKTVSSTIGTSQNKSGHQNTIVLKKLNNVKETKCVDHKNDLWICKFIFKRSIWVQILGHIFQLSCYLFKINDYIL